MDATEQTKEPSGEDKGFTAPPNLEKVLNPDKHFKPVKMPALMDAKGEEVANRRRLRKAYKDFRKVEQKAAGRARRAKEQSKQAQIKKKLRRMGCA